MVILATLVGCSTPMHRSVNQLEKGMDKSQVLELLGSPQRSGRRNSKDHWLYRYYKNQQRQDLRLIFQNGQLRSWGKLSTESASHRSLLDSRSFEDYKKEVQRQTKAKEDGFQSIEGE